MKRTMTSAILSAVLILAMLIQPFGQLPVLAGRLAVVQPSGPAQTNGPLYLPRVQAPPGPPAFEISSPGAGWAIGGVIHFAIQPLSAATVSSVVFLAGATELGADSTPSDGFKVFLDAAAFPSGPLQLSATASGPSGVVTKMITVSVQPSPPTSGTAGSQGAVFASESGSVITIPPGGVPDGTTVAVHERSQEEVTAAHGIEWEALGVTFLGAQGISSSVPISGALYVASAGFANRVQSGQAVVNYRILPDADGDGVDELVAVNGASVGPNNTVVSDPIPQVLVGAPGAGGQASGSQAVQLRGRPGQLLRIATSGLNPLSVRGNIALFESSVNGELLEIPGGVHINPADQAAQIFTVMIPLLAPGPATVRLHNASTGSTSAPLDVAIEAPVPLSKPATEIIAEFLSDTITLFATLPTPSPDHAAMREEAVAALTEAQFSFEELVDAGLTPEVELALSRVALLIQNSDVYDVEGGAGLRPVGFSVSPPDLLVFISLVFLIGVSVGLLIGATIAATPFLIGLANGLAVAVAIASIAFLACVWLGGGTCLADPSPPPNCQLAPAGTAGTTTGMGSAPPPGGPGCGNVVGGGTATRSGAIVAQSSQSGGRFVVKLRSGAFNNPFTAVTDPGGYFYFPMMPAGEPFTATAFDLSTGATRTFEGVGPPLGESVLMFFSFTGISPATPIQAGDVISGTFTTPGQYHVYSFQAEPGQQVFFDILAARQGQYLRVYDRMGTVVVEWYLTSGLGVPGVRTLTQGGTYTLFVSSDGYDPHSIGNYQLQLWNVPPPDQFAIDIGDEIADGAPGPGAGRIETPGVKDVYTFMATSGQQVFFELQASPGLPAIRWQTVDEDGAVLFDTCFGGCGRPGVKTLTRGGTYTMTIGSDLSLQIGTYQLQLWNVPPPDRFAIAIGDEIADGAPGPGAGRIETPGVKDVYIFTATPGQQVFFEHLLALSGVNTIRWQMVDEDGAVLFDEALGSADPGVKSLMRGGTYTLTVGSDQSEQSGTYQLKLWNVPLPEQFAIAIGDVISDGVPGPGAGRIETPGVKDVYTFAATAGQQVFFELQAQSGVDRIRWRTVDEDGAVLFDNFLGVGAGVKTLTRGGIYTLTIGSDTIDQTGTYRIRIRLP